MDYPKLLSVLRACSASRSLRPGKTVHQQIIVLGLQNNTTLSKTLINFYISCQLLNSAKLVFSSLENLLDITLWNGVISTYTRNFMYIEALELFQKLLHRPHLRPDSYTYPSVLKACSGLDRVSYGRTTHSRLIKAGFLDDVVVSSSLVGMYGKCGMFESGIRLFDEVPERDVACWNTVISCNYQDGQYEKALEFFERMKGCGFQPDSVTLTTAISSCARLLDLERGKMIHWELKQEGFELDEFVGTALVDMYGKCGCLDLAEEVFESCRKSIVPWNAMISGYGLRGDSSTCIKLFKRMNEEGVSLSLTTLSSLVKACSRSARLQHGKFIHGYIVRRRIKADIHLDSALIDLYFKCGTVGSAEHVFAPMRKTSADSWNVMISGYVATGNYMEALSIFSDMKEEGVRPDAITFTSILPACSQLAALEKGKEIHDSIVESKFESNEIVMGALLDMFAKCGALDEADRVFHQLLKRDCVSWTSMIMAYGSHGHGLKALRVFTDMQQSNTRPDRVTFLAVMSACSHSGLIDEGCYYFNQMVSEYGILPTVEHYSCLVDLLGRGGRLHEAYEILQRNPKIKEDVELLSTLFSACHMHREIELGEKIARLLIERDPNDPSTLVTLSHMYASVKNWTEVRKVRSWMKELGVKKTPGYSWIEIDKTDHFSSKTSHTQKQNWSTNAYQCSSVTWKRMICRSIDAKMSKFLRFMSSNPPPMLSSIKSYSMQASGRV